MASPTKGQLRKLLVKFYQENDPVVLQQGFDINGLVEFTFDNGVESLNVMLQRKYGQIIDVMEDMGDAQENFKRMSVGLTMSTQIMQKEHEYRQKLYTYFQKHDPSMVSSAREAQFEKFVKYAMLNGLSKLSDKLKQRYGESVTDSGGGSPTKIDTDDVEINFGNSGLNPFRLDVERLRADLEQFFTEMEDEQQLETLDQMTDWACQIGIEEFDSKMDQMYGTSLNAFLKDSGMEEHVNQGPIVEEDSKNALPTQAEEQGEAEYEEEVTWEEVEEEYQVGERSFEEMTDEEIKAELTEFYQEHDVDNLEKLDQVLMLSKKLGRDALNDKLKEIYGEILNPIPITKVRTVQKKVVTKKLKKPVRPTPPEPVQFDSAAINETKPAENDDYEDGWGAEKQEQLEQVQQETSRPADINREDIPQDIEERPPPTPSRAAFNPEPVMKKQSIKPVVEPKKIEEPVVEEAPAEEESEYEDETEFQKIQRRMKKRILAGKARVRDHDGTIMEVNLLIDVCKNYTLDPLSGLCKHCGFAKKDHVYGHKSKGKKKKRR